MDDQRDATSPPDRPAVQCSVTPAAAQRELRGVQRRDRDRTSCRTCQTAHVHDERDARATGPGTRTRPRAASRSTRTPPATEHHRRARGRGTSSTSTSVTFGFSADQPGSTFQCRVYPAALTPAPSGRAAAAATHTRRGSRLGTYTFEVVRDRSVRQRRRVARQAHVHRDRRRRSGGGNTAAPAAGRRRAATAAAPIGRRRPADRRHRPDVLALLRQANPVGKLTLGRCARGRERHRSPARARAARSSGSRLTFKGRS